MRRIGRSRIGLAVAASVLMVAATACRSDGSPSTRLDGPVQFEGGDYDQYSGILAKAGDTVVFGLAVVENQGVEPVRLTSASLHGEVPESAVDISEVRLIDMERFPGDLVAAAMWPYEDFEKRSQELTGFKLAPDAEAELLIVMTIQDTGKWVWPQTYLDYQTSDGTKHQARSTLGFMICRSNSTDCQ